ncbi:1-deoxy-D-xylulose-5-phosphate reductoisomerase [bacterium]|nr:1-deoxy-D-xylulose-5-phosphate reductoisomerase [bacterium]
MKRILLQGSTGSIGNSALSVIEVNEEHFCVAGLSAGHKERELLAQARRWKPESLALLKPSDEAKFRSAAYEIGVAKIFTGPDAFTRQAEELEYDLLLNAVMGSAGVLPTFAALRKSVNVALSNKETLVAAGELVMACARDHGATILPIDSEHSALYQCLQGERISDVRKLWLTTSGGPFWNRKPDTLQFVSPNEALSHPTWTMGPKITIDSATLFNKGLEVIEACRLFDVSIEKVEVVRQRESVIHSMVEFIDGSFKAQLSTPDMRLPILYSLSHPVRIASNIVSTAPNRIEALHFDEVDIECYPCLKVAFHAASAGGTAPAILSAADEVAVESFLAGQIRFTAIAELIEESLNTLEITPADSIEVVMEADRKSRVLVGELVKEYTGSTILN